MERGAGRLLQEGDAYDPAPAQVAKTVTPASSPVSSATSRPSDAPAHPAVRGRRRRRRPRLRITVNGPDGATTPGDSRDRRRGGGGRAAPVTLNSYGDGQRDGRFRQRGRARVVVTAMGARATRTATLRGPFACNGGDPVDQDLTFKVKAKPSSPRRVDGERQRDRVDERRTSLVVEPVHPEVLGALDHAGPRPPALVGGDPRNRGAPHHAVAARAGDRRAGSSVPLAVHQRADDRLVVRRVLDRGGPAFFIPSRRVGGTSRCRRRSIAPQVRPSRSSRAAPGVSAGFDMPHRNPPSSGRQ